MPIYEYVCTACDHRTDILHGINDTGPQFCPSCGRDGTMRKLFAPPTIHYRGSGWAKKDRGAATAARTKAAAGGDTKTDRPKDGGDAGGAASGEPSAAPESTGDKSKASEPSSSARADGSGAKDRRESKRHERGSSSAARSGD